MRPPVDAHGENCVNDNNGVYVAKPSRRQRSNRLAHDLQQSVIENRPNAKKH